MTTKVKKLLVQFKSAIQNKDYKVVSQIQTLLISLIGKEKIDEYFLTFLQERIEKESNKSLNSALADKMIDKWKKNLIKAI